VLRPRGEVDVAVGQARARAALLFLLGLPGAAYLYQGEELGLPEVMDLPDDARQDPIWFRSGGREFGRDGCRVPLPWSAGAPGLGFTTGRPWLPQPDWFAGFAADRQAGDPASMLAFYRSALAARREVFAAAPAATEWLTTVDGVLAYRRGDVVVVTAFGPAPVQLPAAWGEAVMATAGVTARTLPAPGTAWLRA
jgi:alpha-glucosidase